MGIRRWQTRGIERDRRFYTVTRLGLWRVHLCRELMGEKDIPKEIGVSVLVS